MGFNLLTQHFFCLDFDSQCFLLFIKYFLFIFLEIEIE